MARNNIFLVIVSMYINNCLLPGCLSCIHPCINKKDHDDDDDDDDDV